jgi:hypothetical protein
VVNQGLILKKIKTATLVCTAASREGKMMPDFYWLKKT